ncbi:serine/Arginine-related protein 53 [Ricinus communis]|uniref:Arginine/serine-rich coiled coil protein, putative n=1 Tax=Ricinus communis TaxID=3988 RepID=B9R8Z5_RICCO|nr:serine/Arginine-related protein 53 [Ricinus communis]EEF52072.1 Arginine/serine-rich coiled coil protein, putative [Ricinus communis]|eukprot:XP_002511470.1 serine/Arginine-related protein 53 [Ricinus communis]
MEEDKAAAYYEELTRKGEGAARFKQGLGFSSNNSAPSRGSSFSSSSSSFLSNFVKSSSPTQTSKFEKEAQLEAIQNKLKKKPKDDPSSRVSERNSRDSSHRRRSRSRERYSDRDRRHRRSRSRSRSRSRDRRPERRNRRSRSSSPRGRSRSEKSRTRDAEPKGARKEKNGGVDYSKLIHGYENMTAAEKVKARMKFQLNETAEKDPTKGMGSGWERFEFDKDAPLDNEEIEAAEDDAALVKHIGQSFRFSAVEARKNEQIKVAHDEAMFGVPAIRGSMVSDNEPEVVNNEKESTKTDVAAGLLSEKVLAKQQGSWRDRARKAQA